MDRTSRASALSRRFAMGMGAAFAGGITGGMIGMQQAAAQSGVSGNQDSNDGQQGGGSQQQGAGGFPVREMQNIVGAEMQMKHGLLFAAIERKDMTNVTGRAGPTLQGERLRFLPAWTLNGGFWFENIGNNQAIMNADFPFRPDEVNPAIDAMIRHGIVLQALHQHFMALNPPVFFMHMRGTGHPVHLAQGVSAILSATATPRPQRRPNNPQTPFNAGRLAQILGGEAIVGNDGVVTVLIPRPHRVTLSGVSVSPFLHVAANARFMPLDQQGQTAAVAPDFSMTAGNVQTVMHVMRSQGWAVHCLYNQETAEHPQLFYSHQLKVGNPYQLAQEVRRGLNQTQLEGSSSTASRG